MENGWRLQPTNVWNGWRLHGHLAGGWGGRALRLLSRARQISFHLQDSGACLRC